MTVPFKMGVVSLLVLNAFPTVVYAADDAVNLNAIEVHGRRTPAPKLGEVKTRRSQMDENLVQDIRDMVRYDPAVSVVEGGRGNTNGFAIRGVDKDRVAINVDGLAQAESRSSEAFQELFGAYGNYNANRNAAELEHISEVAIRKGADSLASGSGALGGAIDYKTKSPGDVVNADNPFYAAVKGGYTSRNAEYLGTTDLAGYFKGFDARFVFTRRHGHETKNKTNGESFEIKNKDGVYNPQSNNLSNYGSFGKVRTRSDPQDYESKSTLLKGGYHFNEYNYLSALYEDYRMDRKTDELSNLWAADWQGNPSAEKRKRNDVTYLKRHGFQYDNQLDSEKAPWDKLTVNYDKQSIQMSTMTWDVPTDFATNGVNSDLYYVFRRINQDTNQWRVKADKSWAFDKLPNFGWDMSYGFGWSKSQNTNDNYSVFVRAFDPKFETSNRSDGEFLLEAESRKKNVFWNNSFRLGDAFRIGAGVRYDWVRNNTLSNEKFINAMRQKDLEGATAKFNSPSYGLSFDWKFAPGWTLLTKYATGFRTPTTDEMWFTFPHPDFSVKANKNLREEKSHNYEIGLAGQGGWGNLLLSGFHTRYKDFIDFVYLGLRESERWDEKNQKWVNRGYGAPTWQNINRDKATVNGVELSGQWNLDSVGLPRGTFMTYTASYIKGKATQEDGSKTPINALAPWGAVVGLGYKQPDDRWSLKTNLSYTSRKKESDTVHTYEDTKTPWPYARHSKDYFLVDLIGHYRFGKNVTLRGGVFNMFDKQYYTWDSLRSIREFGTVNRVDNATHNGIQRFTAPGRSYALSLEAKF